MELQPRGRCCQCARPYLPRSTAFLFLALVLPASSFAQLTTSLTQTTRAPTTLSTSAVPSSTSPSTPTVTPVLAVPTSAPTGQGSTTTEASHAFNYYFLIIAGAVILGSFCVLYIGRRKKRKAALIQTRGQRELARDVEGWRARWGVGRVGIYNSNIHETGVEDGLNERGEAPPPYVPGSKPPSISSDELRRPSTAASSHLHTEPVELSNMGAASSPPGYNEHFNRASENGLGDITRPGPVITASARQSSVRRPTSSTGSL